MSAESRTLARESPIRPMYFEARITRISYTLGRSCDPLAKNEPVDYRSNRTFIVNAGYEAVTKRPHSDKDSLRYKINTEKLLEDHAPEECNVRLIICLLSRGLRVRVLPEL